MIRFVAIDLWDCSLDPAERALCGSHQDGTAFSCNLSKPEYRLLQRLLMEPGEPVSRDDLTGHAWNGRPVTAGSLSNAVFNLRQAFGPNDGHKVIRTVPSQGYRIEARVLDGLALQPAIPAEGPEAPAMEQAPGVTTKRPWSRGWVPALVAVALVNLGAVFWYAQLRATPSLPQTPHRLTYEYLADIGERRFFTQVSPLPASDWTERALKAFVDYPPQRGADKHYVYLNRGDSDDELSFFLCQNSLDAAPPNCSTYVIQRDPHS